ncbi:MAG: DUF1015 family protein, partial [Acidimicrobiia bacterium]
DLIDEAALLEAIEEKDLRVGLDVYPGEPGSSTGPFDSSLAGHPNVYGTHHIGASTEQAQLAIADQVVVIVDGFARGSVENAVNLEAEPVGLSVIIVRQLDRVGVLAGVLEVLRRSDLNVEQMENTVFAGARAASAAIHVSHVPDSTTLNAIAGLDHVIAVSAGSVKSAQPLVRPFRAYIPRPDLAAGITAPPLASITTDSYERLAADNPDSILHVLRSAIDTSEGASDPVFADAGGGAQLRRMVRDGSLIHQPARAFYVYRVDAAERSHVGVIAEVAASGLGEGKIRRHEDTRRETEDLVLAHLKTVRAHSDPVAMAHRNDPALAAELDAAMGDGEPTLDFPSGEGHRHRLWVVDEPDPVERLESRLAAIDALYITDGHHRSVAAARLAAAEAASNPTHTGLEEYNYYPAVLYAESQLALDGYHRALSDLGGPTPGEFLATLTAVCAVEELAVPWDDEAKPREPGVVAMFLEDRWYRLDLPVSPTDDVYSRLDAVVLQRQVLGPMLGVSEPRADPRLHYIPGPAGLGEFSRYGAVVGFALHPPSTREVMAVADAGRVMPPKSTWFRPKVRAGLVIRRF